MTKTRAVALPPQTVVITGVPEGETEAMLGLIARHVVRIPWPVLRAQLTERAEGQGSE